MRPFPAIRRLRWRAAERAAAGCFGGGSRGKWPQPTRRFTKVSEHADESPSEVAVYVVEPSRMAQRSVMTEPSRTTTRPAGPRRTVGSKLPRHNIENVEEWCVQGTVISTDTPERVDTNPVSQIGVTCGRGEHLLNYGHPVAILRINGITEPLPKRLSPSHPRFTQIMELHEASCNAGEPCYRDPATGLSVMTASFLASRGYCCASGCRHCPFEQDA